MNPNWYQDARFWVDAAGVLLTAVFSWLLYRASVRAAKAAEEATRISSLLWEERARALYARRLPFLRAAKEGFEKWIKVLDGDEDVAHKLFSVTQEGPTWVDQELFDTAQKPEFSKAILDIQDAQGKLLDYWFRSGPKDLYGNPVVPTDEQVAVIKPRLDSFTAQVRQTLADTDALIRGQE